jgi:hypothetical protein
MGGHAQVWPELRYVLRITLGAHPARDEHWDAVVREHQLRLAIDSSDAPHEILIDRAPLSTTWPSSSAAAMPSVMPVQSVPSPTS